ncbi:regulatory subunit 4 [Musa troglodytarum]|uniref:Regulatory subunit 4 n=1 Tax=Musa troglodytarum TaxID=320322 RepID=A0A9E7FQI3_9LILI|nr:regulatory subunit 4 [Musa troglodytarum]
MGQGTPRGMGKQGHLGDRKHNDDKNKKFEPTTSLSRVRRKQQIQEGLEAVVRLPTVTLLSKCRLRILKLECVKDYLLMEEEFIANQERLRPYEKKNKEGCSKVNDLQGSSMSVRNLEELIDENHAIISLSIGSSFDSRNCYADEHYLSTLLSMVDPTGIANWSVTHVDWSEGKWHPKAYRAQDVTFELLKNITSIVENYHVTSDEKLSQSPKAHQIRQKKLKPLQADRQVL